MKRVVVLVPLVLAGCSTAPIADLLDFFKPGRIGPGPYHGGVINQHGVPAAPPPAVSPVIPASPPPVPPPEPLVR